MAVCMSAQHAKHRGPAIEAELYAEYKAVFQPVAQREPRWTSPLEHCAESAVNVALCTRIPVFYKTVEDLVCKMHPVQLVVVKVFLEHLTKTWFGIQNALLTDITRHVNALIASIRNSTPGTKPQEGDMATSAAPSLADVNDFGNVFDCWDSSVQLEKDAGDTFEYWRRLWRL